MPKSKQGPPAENSCGRCRGKGFITAPRATFEVELAVPGRVDFKVQKFQFPCHWCRGSRVRGAIQEAYESGNKREYARLIAEGAHPTDVYPWIGAFAPQTTTPSPHRPGVVGEREVAPAASPGFVPIESLTPTRGETQHAFTFPYPETFLP